MDDFDIDIEANIPSAKVEDQVYQGVNVNAPRFGTEMQYHSVLSVIKEQFNEFRFCQK